MILTAIQMHTTPDIGANIATARRLMERAVAEHGSDWILLPEHFHWAGGGVDEVRGTAEILGEGPAYEMCRAFAAEHSVFVHAGSLFEEIPGDARVYNTSIAFDRAGNEVARYRKTHLFDMVGADGVENRESDVVKPGDDLVVYQADDVRIGCTICYDLRFPDLFQALARHGADVIAFPAAFTRRTGQAHWEPLVRARAIETQAYMVASAAFGDNVTGAVGRSTFGHSMIVDPWGVVMEVLADGEGFVSARFDRALVDKVRSDMQVAAHRRHALYGRWSAGA